MSAVPAAWGHRGDLAHDVWVPPWGFAPTDDPLAGPLGESLALVHRSRLSYPAATLGRRTVVHIRTLTTTTGFNTSIQNP